MRNRAYSYQDYTDLGKLNSTLQSGNKWEKYKSDRELASCRASLELLREVKSATTSISDLKIDKPKKTTTSLEDLKGNTSLEGKVPPLKSNTTSGAFKWPTPPKKPEGLDQIHDSVQNLKQAKSNSRLSPTKPSKPAALKGKQIADEDYSGVFAPNSISNRKKELPKFHPKRKSRGLTVGVADQSSPAHILPSPSLGKRALPFDRFEKKSTQSMPMPNRVLIDFLNVDTGEREPTQDMISGEYSMFIYSDQSILTTPKKSIVELSFEKIITKLIPHDSCLSNLLNSKSTQNLLSLEYSKFVHMILIRMERMIKIQ
jgi:hypothetical protein